MDDLVSTPEAPSGRPLKVLFIHHIPVIGGATNSLRFLLRAFPAESVRPLILCQPGAAFGMFQREGWEVQPVSSLSTFGSSVGLPMRGWRLLDLINTLLHFRSGPAIAKAIREFQPDLVHVNERTLLHAAWIAKRRGLPVVMHARNVADRETRWIHRLTIRWMDRLADTVIAIDGSVAHSLRELTRCLVIHNPGRHGLEEEGKAGCGLSGGGPGQRLRAEKPPGRTRFLFLAILRDFKGIWEFLEAARLLRDRSDIEWIIAGGNSRPPEYYRTALARAAGLFGFAPDVEKQVREWVEKENLSSTVKLLGHVAEVERLLAEVDVNVFPSRLNGPSRSVFECGMRGIPSIVAMRDKVEDVVRDGVTGLIVPERDPGALAEAAARLADDPSLRQKMGENARRAYQEQFDPAKTAGQVLAVYRRLSKRGAGASGVDSLQES